MDSAAAAAAASASEASERRASCCDEQRVGGSPDSAAPPNATQQCQDDERERLLWITKKHVKQMMEEAVTKKFIHEESSSIISLCVATEACLSHGLKRRALGLFKTNSSSALVQKLAKTCPSAQEVLDLVELEEKRIAVESQRQQARVLQQRRSANSQHVNAGATGEWRHCSSDSSSNATSNSNYSATSAQAQVTGTGSSRVATNLQHRTQVFGQQRDNLQPSNLNIHKRNIWIKLALIERKLVSIIDHLAENASKYYEKDALMSSTVCAQILSSLLVGPCALEFSRSKTNDFYQFEEPSADELLRRHQLSFPIACLCSQQTTDLTPSQRQLARSATDGSNNSNRLALVDTGAPVRQLIIGALHSPNVVCNDKNNNTSTKPKETSTRATSPICGTTGLQVTGATGRKESQRKRPLALKSNVKTGALVTDCHHYSCQDINEHQHTRGYSFRCTSSVQTNASQPSSGPQSTSGTSTAGAQSNPINSNQAQAVQSKTTASIGSTNNTANAASAANQAQVSSLKATLESSVTTATAAVVAQEWSLWSPRMLHETLHQNSKSRLLYAKNNVLLETQQSETIAGYLSLHQTTNDLILKWIPNQMINGSQRPSNTGKCQCQSDMSTAYCECVPPTSAASPGISSSTAGDSTKDKLAFSRRSSCTNISPCDKQQQQQQTLALGSSYLDLVVNLSVSRIVLMHCQFGSKQTNAAANGHTNEERQCDPTQATCQAQNLNDTQVQLADSIEDTLILVEADGVQRAPFKFPKGGLRWFLSCLETGLGPDKYLEPAIKPDNLGCAPDPLQELNIGNSMLTSNESESPSISSESTGGRLDMLLRRLPSLKRGLKNNNQVESNSKDSSGNMSPEPVLGASASDNSSSRQQVTYSRLANNYVYRIVPVQQSEWLLQTPPHSALSVTSSASSSATKSVCKKTNNTNNNDSTARGQKFRWSLSRLTKFSNIYSNSASTTSSSSVVCGPMSDGYDARSVSIGTGRSTLENTSLTDFNDGNSFDTNIISSGENDTLNMFANRQHKSDRSQDFIRVEAKLNDLKKSTSDEIAALRTQSIQTLCESMRKQILSRAFYGWLVYYRRAKLIRSHLVKLIKNKSQRHLLVCDSEAHKLACNGLTWAIWSELRRQDELDESELKLRVSQLVYYGGIENDELRAEIWPYLLEHYKFKDTNEIKANKDKSMRESYESCAKEWTKIEAVVKQRDNELLMANMARVGSRQVAPCDKSNQSVQQIESGTSATSCSESQSDIVECVSGDEHSRQASSGGPHALKSGSSVASITDEETTINDENAKAESTCTTQKMRRAKLDRKNRARRRRRRARLESTGSVGSDASITDRYGNNIHRIDKDVQRCDRNFYYFKDAKNLDKLRNIMCTYVWQHIDVGYVQGMCDLAAPFLVIFNDETMAHNCFCQLMKRMVANFPHGSAMDQHFESLKYLMQILDPKLFEILQCDGDYTHFYFCYRWLLLDFKRELVYADVYKVWEAIWSARNLVTENFVVFVALAMVRYYRDIIIENNMDFTDTIKFFNEMAEHHDADKILSLARDCVVEVENLVTTIATGSKD